MRHFVSALLLGAAVPFIGCAPTLPPCDEAAAREVVYLDAPSDVTDDDGVPMYLGQALIHTSCSGAGLCHSSLADDAMRVGVPFGDDYDLDPPCIDAACAPGDASDAAFRGRLLAVRDRRQELYARVHDGHMPPGHVGATVVGRSGSALRIGAGGALVPIPSITSDEGKRAFGVWLACGAPVVETASAPDASHAPGDSCAANGDAAGACVTRSVPSIVAPDPTWDSIYTRVIGPLCGESCHGDTTPRADGPTLLGIDAAYETLLHTLSDEGLHYVTPGDPVESHLLFHLDGSPDHEVMPPALLTHTLPTSVVDAIRAWIVAGAQR